MMSGDHFTPNLKFNFQAFPKFQTGLLLADVSPYLQQYEVSMISFGNGTAN